MIPEATKRNENQLALVDGSAAALPMPSLSLRDFLGILQRRKAIAINTFVLIVALGVVLTLTTKPVFQSSARVLVEPPSTSITVASADDNNIAPLFNPRSSHDVGTQVEIFRSPVVINQAFKEGNLTPGSVALDVKQVEATDVIELTGTSNDRTSVESFISTLPKIYAKNARSDRLGGITSALDFYQKSLDAENTKLSKTEADIERFKKKAQVTDPKAEAITALAEATKSRESLGAAQALVASLQAQLNTLTQQRHSLSAFIDNPVTTTNGQIQVLNNQLGNLQSERNQKLFLYQPTDDVIRQLDRQIADLQQRIANAPKTITTSSLAPNPAVAETDGKIAEINVSLEAARTNLETANAQVLKSANDLNRFTTIERLQAQLQRDQQTSSESVTSLNNIVRQLTQKQKALEAVGSPVTTLQAGGQAVQILPKPSRNMTLAVALGIVLACAAALLIESLDDHVRDEEVARHLFNTAVLGYFPVLSESSNNANGRPLLNLAQPNRALLEQFRMLRSNVQFTLVNNPGRKLLVTSTMPGEGKSYVSSNLAIAMALDGRRVILVDTDLHRPRVHQTFGIEQKPGLTNVLVGQAVLEEVIQESGIPGLRILPAGILPPNPVELLNSPAMDAIFEKLEKSADIVIFDSPPVLATSDSQVMASKVDGVLYVMELGRVPRSALQRSFELLNQANAHIIGMVFNKIEQGQGKGYGGYGQYYYQYNSYTEDNESSNGHGKNGLNGSSGWPFSRAKGQLTSAGNGKTNGSPASSTSDKEVETTTYN